MIMHACGKTHDQIAHCVGPLPGIDANTLRKHFAHELAIAKDKLDGICMTGIAKAMQAGEAWALCFYAKTRMGWKEVQRVEHTGEDGAPIDLNVASEKESLADRIAGVAARLGTDSVSSVN